MDLKKVGLIIIIVLVTVGVTLTWRFTPDYTTLYKDGKIIARHRWHVEAERTYISKNSYYRRTVICPRIVAMGGHETATRCYYPDDYYEQLSRSLIGTKLENNTDIETILIERLTPYYKYGTNGAYAGKLNETFTFIETVNVEEFPDEYAVEWKPRDTRNYILVWRVWELNITLPVGEYHDCTYVFDDVKIDLMEECADLDRAVVKNDETIWFYFNNKRGEQKLKVNIVDPVPTEPSIEMVNGSSWCKYHDNTSLDWCSTKYLVCDNSTVKKNDISFLFREENIDNRTKNKIIRKERYKTIDKFKKNKLDIEIEMEKKDECLEVTVAGWKSAYYDVDNVLCHKDVCAYNHSWWHASWGYRMVIHVNSTGTTTFNITINQSIDTATLITAGKMQADCNDTRFINSTDDTFELAFEFENRSGPTYGCDNTNTIFHINVPALDGNNRSIAIYYDNAGASDSEDVTGTWADYNAQYVYHLDQDAVYIVPSSTGNFNGYLGVGNGVWLATAYIGPGFDCGSTKTHRINSTFELGVDYVQGFNFTSMLWFKEAPGGTDAYRCMLASAGGPDWAICFDAGDAISDDDTIGFRVNGGGWGHTGAVPDYSDGEWHHAVIGYDDGADAFAYIDGELADTQPTANVWDRGFIDYCYRAAGGLGNFQGELDEIRTYNYAMSADQIKRIYETQRAYIQAEEEAPSGDNPPYFILNSTNSTLAGEQIEHRLNWNDDTGLSGYIFEFCDGYWNGTDCLNGTVTENLISSTETSYPMASWRSICKDGSGILHVIFGFNTTERYYSNSSDNGVTWTTNTSFFGATSTSTSTKAGGYISCDGNNITVSYEDTAADDVIMGVSIDNSKTWTWSNPITSSVKLQVQNERRGDRIYVIYRNNAADNEIMFFNSTDGGATWGSATSIMAEAGEDMGATSFAVDGDGSATDKIYVVSQNSLDGDVYFTNSTDSGNNWGAKTKIISGDDNKFDTSITFSGSNVFVICDDATSKNIHFVNSSDYGVTWGSSFVINQTKTSDAPFSHVTVDDKGNPVVFWSSNSTNDNQDLVYRRYNTTGNSQWGNEVFLTNNNNGNEKPNTAYKYYGDGRIHYIWLNGTDPYQILYSFLKVGGGWVNDSFVSMTGTNNWSNVSKTINPTVGVNISWRVYANDSTNQWNQSSTYVYITTSAVGDTCDTCTIDATENCVVDTDLDCEGGILKCTGSGKVRVEARIYNYIRMVRAGGCHVFCSAGKGCKLDLML